MTQILTKKLDQVFGGRSLGGKQCTHPKDRKKYREYAEMKGGAFSESSQREVINNQLRLVRILSAVVTKSVYRLQLLKVKESWFPSGRRWKAGMVPIADEDTVF